MAGRGRPGRSGVLGITSNTNCSSFRVHYKRHYVGSFATIERAKRAYDEFKEKADAEASAKREYDALFR